MVVVASTRDRGSPNGERTLRTDLCRPIRYGSPTEEPADDNLESPRDDDRSETFSFGSAA